MAPLEQVLLKIGDGQRNAAASIREFSRERRGRKEPFEDLPSLRVARVSEFDLDLQATGTAKGSIESFEVIGAHEQDGAVLARGTVDGVQ